MEGFSSRDKKDTLLESKDFSKTSHEVRTMENENDQLLLKEFEPEKNVVKCLEIQFYCRFLFKSSSWWNAF